MKYTIISDSCCDLKNADLTNHQIDFVTVPISYTLGNQDYVDNEDTDTKELVTLLKSNKSAPKSACPSPETFAEKMRAGSEHIICVTISSRISGTYNSACIAAEMVRAEHSEKKIFVFDSLSASAGVARILYKLVALIESGEFDFDEITKKLTEIRGKNKIRFLLNDLSNLVKSGRMSKIAGLITSVIPIKLICGDNGDGEIKKYSQVLGFKKGVEELSNFPGEALELEGADTPVVISHCNNEESASILKSLLETKFGFKNIKTLLMRGIATFFANDKGLAIAY